MIIGIVAFVVALLVSIMLHEAGHFVTAKRFGMKASRFFLGFGPTLWSVRRGETEYGVKALPLGGFVKIEGMTQLEEVDPGDEARAFYRQPAPQRAVVLAAGSFMHFVIGFLLLFLIFSAVGQSEPTTVVRSVSACTAELQGKTCQPGDPEAPAALAGVQPGDRVVSFEGRPVTSWDQLTTLIRDHGAGPVALGVRRNGQTLTLHPDLVALERPSFSDPSKTETVGSLGIAHGDRTVREGVWSGLADSGDAFGQSFVATFKALGAIPGSIPKLFDATVHGTQRDATGLAGPVDIARVSGQIAGGSNPLADKIAYLLGIFATLNIFVGIFNLLPLLPLDGGHLAILGFEEGRKRLYRLVGRADPGRVDLTKLLPVAYLVIALFVGLSVLLLAAGIVNPIANPFG